MKHALLALLLAFSLAGLAAAEPAPWPEGRRAAIALTYDDTLQSQLDHALPQLDAAGLKGTFYLMGRGFTPDLVSPWRAAAANGHELGNHTLVHPCARGAYEMPDQYNLEAYTVDTMLAEIRTMNAFLTALDGKAEHSYATPCGHNLAGGEDYVAPIEQSGLATYVRDERASLPENAPPIMAAGFADVTGAQMIAWAERVRDAGAFGVVVFHGVGGDYLSVSAEAHDEFVTYLAAHPREYWVATFSAVMERISAM